MSNLGIVERCNKLSDERDETIAQHLDRYRLTRKRQGVEAAKHACLNDLVSCVFWLNLNYGERQTYDVLQRLADDQLGPIA
jgi:hypothetical protein